MRTLYFVLFLSFFLLLFPRVISAIADWMCSILPHMVWPYSANLEYMSEIFVLHAARWKYRTQKIAKKLPSHKFVGLCLRN